MTRIFKGLTLSICLLAASSYAETGRSKVDNFVLLDQAGKAHELYYYKDAPAMVLVARSARCESGDHAATFRSLAAAAGKASVLVIDAEDSRAQIAAATKAAGSTLPVLHDAAGIISQGLRFTRSGEALVVDPRSWQVAYQGPLANPAFEASLAGVVAGREVAYQFVETPGCELKSQPPRIASYAGEIAPILQKNCMACHIEGGIGPWAMSEYRMVQGFAPMMREVIRVKRMPPWHADPAVGQWQHSAALSNEDTRTLINWIEAGAPRGDGPDPLLAERIEAPTWPLGQPDLILEVPSFDVPATGVVDYQFPVVANPLDRDVWVRAATIIPGNTKVVHHVLMGSADKAPEKEDRESVFGNYIMGYAPGNESAYMPEGTGVFVPVGGVYQFQLHYTPVGVATTDTTRVGLYFSDTPPANFLRQQVVLNPRLKIPANTSDHEVSAYFEFWDDATIYSLVPHAHYRGKSSTFELGYPDGRKEVILSVPNYDFNWQRTYSFVEPKVVPKGTRIVHKTLYDNSAKNARNPDPEREVPWGLQSFDEMLYGSVSYSWNNERSDAPLHSKVKSDASQFIGFSDKNMDGKLSKDELPNRMRESLGWWKWWFVDTNFDGGLDVTELVSMFSGR